MSTMIIDFFGFDIPRNHFKLKSISKPRRCYERWPLTWNNQTHEKLYKFYKMPRNLQNFGMFPYHITLPNTWEFFATLWDYFAKGATTMSPQSLIKLICGLTRRQESSGMPQTLTLRKLPLKVPIFNNNCSINAKDRSKHFSAGAARMVSCFCLPGYSDHEKQVSS